jgi:hypothetical protein
MRILVDEDTALQLMDPLRHVLPRHEVTHVSDISWKGKKDRQVLPTPGRPVTTSSSPATAPS